MNLGELAELKSRGMMRYLTDLKLREVLVYVLSGLLLVFPLLYATDLKLKHWKFWTYPMTLGEYDVFIFLAFVPGVVAIVYHLITGRERRDQNRSDVLFYYAWLNQSSRRRGHQAPYRVTQTTKGPVSANCATLLLTAVFLFIAIVAAHPKWSSNLSVGVVYAGLGAYISVLYFMVGRLYASALTSRFLMSSAIGSASAVVIGWVFCSIGVSVLSTSANNFNLATVLFLTGLFHKWAFDALRLRARKLFGQPEAEAVELTINAIEGVDDVHADLLSEYGVSTVQHLATAEPGEILERTRLPLDRIIDWIDQAILISYLKKNILSARVLCVRGAIDLVMIYDRELSGAPASAMSKLLLDSLAEKSSMTRASIDAIAIRLRHDFSVAFLYELREGKAYDPIPPTP